MTQRIRTFIGIAPDMSARRKLIAVTRRLRTRVEYNGLRWIAPRNLHCTLLFLGNQELDDLQALSRVLQKALSHTPGFSIETGQLGGFPKAVSSVLAAHIAANDELSNLQAVVEQAVQAQNLSYDHKSFTPHITLARCKRARNLTPQALQITSSVAQVILYQSQTFSEGAVYTALDTFNLRN